MRSKDRCEQQVVLLLYVHMLGHCTARHACQPKQSGRTAHRYYWHAKHPSATMLPYVCGK
jgi:hypothetical protein